MSTSTTRLNLTKPASSENVSITIIDSNYDLIDTAVGATIGTSASRPASAFQGRLYYTTDSTKLYANTAANASTVASWADPVANALLSAVIMGSSVSASGGITSYRSLANSAALGARVYADTQDRFQVTAGGSATWGSGSATQDVNLYRSAADTLKTDDSLVVAGGITAVGNISASTTMSVGGMLSANAGITVAGGKGQMSYVRKSLSTGRISTTTLADDPHLTFTLAASGVYELRAHLAVSGAAAGDFKTAWNVTGAASGGTHTSRSTHGPTTAVSDATAATALRTSRHSLATAAAYGVDGTNVSAIEEKCLLDTTAGSGTITLQWAQNSSTATSTVVSSDSWAVLWRLA